ncbi:hypothetical protein D3C83_127890 [compost metagenome]
MVRFSSAPTNRNRPAAKAKRQNTPTTANRPRKISTKSLVKRSPSKAKPMAMVMKNSASSTTRVRLPAVADFTAGSG